MATGNLSPEKTIPVDGLIPGAYLLRLKNNAGASVNTKVVKQ
jgi:hypothetical protein